MFLAKFPYSDNQQLNLDWVLEQIRYLSDAAHIDFDDTIAALGADNVQGAIEKLKELLDLYASQLSGVAIIDSAIPESNFTGGYTYNHLQTVNDPTLTAVIDAVKLERYIVLKRHSGNTTGYFICSIINEVPGDYKHQVVLIDPVTLVTSEIDIYGINDADNIYCDIIADVNQTRVNSFNGRDGAVTPDDADYDASQVVYDDTNTNLGTTRVQAAIEAIVALIPLLFVASFNGRYGAVTPQASDYDADQIDYDNRLSGLTATNAQAAIDEIVSLVLASGVASFNGRTGAVNPQSGDYDAGMIDYDNTTSGLTATDVQAAIDELAGPTTVTITLTLNGAKEDTITVKDSSNTTIGTCIFASGQTSGTLTVTVTSGYSDTWTFTSSVAKDTTTGTNDYSMTQTITDSASQTVDVMPSNVVYWYGNGTLTGYAIPFSSGGPTVTPTLTQNTNSVAYNGTSGGGFAVLGAYDMTGLTKAYMDIDVTASPDDTHFCIKSDTTTYLQGDRLADATFTSNAPFNGITSLTFNALSGTNYIGLFQRPGGTAGTGAIKRIWLE